MTDTDPRTLERRNRARNRAAEQAERWKLPITTPVTGGVVGVSFTEHYPDNLTALDEALVSSEPAAAILRRNPANEHDENAIEVHVPALGEMAMIGHLPRAMAVRMAPEMDRGGEFRAEVVQVRIHPDHPDRPGIDVRIWRPTDADQ